MGPAWLLLAVLGCASARPFGEGDDEERGVVPGITVLVRDSLEIIRGKRIGLLADPRLGDADGKSDADVLADARVRDAKVTVLSLPTDRPLTAAALQAVDVLVVDLQGDGTRLGSEMTTLVEAMRAAATAGKPVLVLDRPAPLNGERTEGGIPDSALLAAMGDRNGPAMPTGLYPVPLRHGMTTGELARVLDERLAIGASPRVVPMRGWRREMWFDDTELRWVPPSPEATTPATAYYRALVAPLEGSNVRVERDGEHAYRRIAAPWLDARRMATLIEDREVQGVRLRPERVRVNDADGRRTMPGLRIEIVGRDVAQLPRISAYLIWALVSVGGDSLRLDPARAAAVFGSEAPVRALLGGADPDEVADQLIPPAVTFRESARSSFLYYR
jgi:uncharacterized protein YbbC (DUF1343 family)